MDAAGISAKIADLFHRRGASEYGGEAVTQEEHALQSALLAEQAGATPQLILASLLHDVGHLLHNLADDAPDQGVDDVHEHLGNRWLQRYFTPAVCEPVKNHVAAKRYLCAVDPAYMAELSPPSIQSLALQGGPFDVTEVQKFETEPFFKESVQLRRWDDTAKIVGLETPDVAHYLSYVPACLLDDQRVEVAT